METFLWVQSVLSFAFLPFGPWALVGWTQCARRVHTPFLFPQRLAALYFVLILHYPERFWVCFCFLSSSSVLGHQSLADVQI